MDSEFFYQCSESEADHQKHECSAEQSKVGINAKVAKSGGGQNTSDTGSEIDTFLKGFACIAVDVGQHTGKTAQSCGDEADGHLEAKVIGYPRDRNASGGTASDVLPKIAH
jgi:hypothetical protein